MSRTIAWDVLEKQLEENSEYHNLLACDRDLHQLLKKHYIASYLPDNQPSVYVPDSSVEAIHESKYSQVYERFTSVLSSVSFPSALDFRGKRIGPIALEFDFLKQLESLPKQVWESIYGRLSFDVLKELQSFSESSKEPREETVVYMSALMDRATHLSNFIKPHESSPVIYTVADHDCYIPTELYQVTPKDLWPQTEVRRLDCGHVMGILQHQSSFREAIRDAFIQLGCVL